MKPMEVLDLPADSLPGNAVATLFFSDQRPLDGPAALLDWRLDGQLTRLLLDGRVTGRAGEHLVLQNNGKLKADWVLLVGGGKWGGLCHDTYRSLVDHLLTVARQAGFADLSLCLAPHAEANREQLADMVGKALKQQGRTLNTCRLSREPLLGAGNP